MVEDTVGDAREIWKPISGYSGYLVSNQGRVWSQQSGRVLVGDTNRNGYVSVDLPCRGTWKHRLVHRLVLLAFVGPPTDGNQCCHANGNRKDNRIENLRWGTAKQNYADKVLHGTNQVGERNGFSKLTAGQAREIVVDHTDRTNVELAKKYGVSHATISLVRQGRTWVAETGLSPQTNKHKHLSSEQVESILRLRGSMSQRNAASASGVSQTTVASIWNGKRIGENS